MLYVVKIVIKNVQMRGQTIVKLKQKNVQGKYNDGLYGESGKENENK